MKKLYIYEYNEETIVLPFLIKVLQKSLYVIHIIVLYFTRNIIFWKDNSKVFISHKHDILPLYMNIGSKANILKNHVEFFDANGLKIE